MFRNIYRGNYIKRTFAGRAAPSSRSSGRAEMTFREVSELPSPYDVLDRNVHGIESRAIWNEIRKVTEQIKLDLPELRKLGEVNQSALNSEESRNDFAYEITYQTQTTFPGISTPTEESITAAVTLTAYLDQLNVNEKAKQKLRSFFGLDASAQTFQFTVTDFPFITQNMKRAVELLEELIRFSQNDKVHIQDILGTSTPKAASQTKKPLQFPQEWLQKSE